MKKPMQKPKWHVAIAASQGALDHGVYDLRPARTRAQAMSRARSAVLQGRAAAFVLKHAKTKAAYLAAGIKAEFDGLYCREWTPHGVMSFIPDPRLLGDFNK